MDELIKAIEEYGNANVAYALERELLTAFTIEDMDVYIDGSGYHIIGDNDFEVVIPVSSSVHMSGEDQFVVDLTDQIRMYIDLFFKI